MIKAVIFDLDGVLVTTDSMHYEAWKKLGEEIGITNFTKEDNIRQRGISRMASLEILLEKTDKKYTDAEKEELAERKNAYYKEMLETLSEKDVLSGAKEFLVYLKEQCIKTAVGSASKNAPVILEKTGLLPFLDAVACGLDVTKSKPDPQVFLVAANKLDTDPKECMVFEDADAGIEAAKRGGMYAFAVGAARYNKNADMSAESLEIMKQI
mgnify:FL=1